MKKMLVSDYDQTFYISDDDIELNKIIVDKFMKLGNIFAIATGRSYFDFNNKLNMYNFKYDYVILNHGATIIDKNNNVLLNVSMSNDIMANLKIDLELEKSLNWFCCSGIESRVDFEHIDLTKINVKYSTKEVAMEKAQIINKKYGQDVNAYYVNVNSVEIISKKINKASSIYEVMNKEQIKKEDVYTIGDGYSDIEMIKEFNGYCMNESVEELKNISIKEVSSVSVLVKELLGERTNE